MNQHDDTKAVLALLKERVGTAGSHRAWAVSAGLSHTYVCDVARGAKPPGPRILAALGVAKHTVYGLAGGTSS
ncbi:hypothetical protein [Methylobacterium flocculans]|uniref:hypothetical protein n=1 Tax=Methylobacterium flocculans TaxID=2984843 RepID=UPI00116AE5E5|nr:hypothetical protein [Methylobacterium sp. FF17]GEL44430.1 hypothetical protein MEX01_50210 [Methylorubrum extorquens]